MGYVNAPVVEATLLHRGVECDLSDDLDAHLTRARGLTEVEGAAHVEARGQLADRFDVFSGTTTRKVKRKQIRVWCSVMRARVTVRKGSLEVSSSLDSPTKA